MSDDESEDYDYQPPDTDDEDIDIAVGADGASPVVSVAVDTVKVLHAPPPSKLVRQKSSMAMSREEVQHALDVVGCFRMVGWCRCTNAL